MDREDPPALGEEVAALWGRARRADLVLYGLVALLVGVGACARPLWERADPRVRVWSAWHSGSEALDPWGQAFLDDARRSPLGGPQRPRWRRRRRARPAGRSG